MLFVDVGYLTDRAMILLLRRNSIPRELGKWPNIFQSFQPVQVIQDSLRRAFAESLARAICKFTFELVCSHRNLGPPFECQLSMVLTLSLN